MNSKLIFSAVLSLIALQIYQLDSAASKEPSFTQSSKTSVSSSEAFDGNSPNADIEIRKNAKGHIELSWAKSTAAKTESFLIQRSENGKNFRTIGRRGVQKNASVYSFEDAARTKLVFYRLIEVDVDGNVSYSKIVSTKG